MVQGTYNYLAPNKSLGLYSVTVDNVSTMCTGVSGGLLLMWIITAYGFLFTNMSTLKSIGVAQIPLTASNLRNMFNGNSKSTGCSMPGQWLNLAITSFVAHAYLSGADYTTQAVQVLAVYIGLANIQCCLAPEGALKSLGIDKKQTSPITIFVTKVLGHQVIVAAILIGALINNVDAYKALSYSQIPCLLLFLLFIILDDFDALVFKKSKT